MVGGQVCNQANLALFVDYKMDVSHGSVSKYVHVTLDAIDAF